ncbi:MAG: hypothetical protein QF662_01930 [Phycisphaerae bacterium]|jgi:hypothetical protein|nr:hypothetical protein [Phycisphaerae bacterium]
MHADKLRQGDFGLGDDSVEFNDDALTAILTGQPYHLRELIKGKYDSAPVLIELLQDETPTPYYYYDTLTFIGGLYSGDLGPRRTATISDMADYALRAIFKTDVGFRSYKPKSERKAAIQRWMDVAQRGNLKE